MNKKMKILFMTDNFPPQTGGIARFSENICKQLGLRGHSVDVLSVVDHPRKSLLNKSNYRVFESKRHRSFASVPIILRTLLFIGNKYDILFMSSLMTTNALGVYILNRLFRVPFVLLLHGFDMNYLKSRYYFDRLLARLYLKRASLILVNSAATGRKAILNGASQAKIKILNPGIDTEFFSRKMRVGGRGSNGGKIILTVARLVKRKGHKFVIEALAKMKDELLDVHYMVVGGGPEKDNLVKLADELQVSDKVIFLENVEDDKLPEYYSLSDLFVMPTLSDDYDYEGFGMAYLEANACGLPVIGARNGGVTDAIVDGKTGVLVREKDAVELSQAIKRLLGDDVLRSRMGETGRTRAKEYFSWNVIGKKLEDYLKECLGRN